MTFTDSQVRPYAIGAYDEAVSRFGLQFRTADEVAAYYAQHGITRLDDRERGLYVAIVCAWRLHTDFPDAGIGLEFYAGASGLSLPMVGGGRTPSLSFDIVLLGRRGPSTDILANGVTPTSQIDPSTSATDVESWTQNWRPPIDPALLLPHGGDVVPGPIPVPVPDPIPPASSVPDPRIDEALVRLQGLAAQGDLILAHLAGLQNRVDTLDHKLNRPLEGPVTLFGVRGSASLTPKG